MDIPLLQALKCLNRGIRVVLLW